MFLSKQHTSKHTVPSHLHPNVSFTTLARRYQTTSNDCRAVAASLLQLCKATRLQATTLTSLAAAMSRGLLVKLDAIASVEIGACRLRLQAADVLLAALHTHLIAASHAGPQVPGSVAARQQSSGAGAMGSGGRRRTGEGREGDSAGGGLDLLLTMARSGEGGGLAVAAAAAAVRLAAADEQRDAGLTALQVRVDIVRRKDGSGE